MGWDTEHFLRSGLLLSIVMVASKHCNGGLRVAGRFSYGTYQPSTQTSHYKQDVRASWAAAPSFDTSPPTRKVPRN
eukprot:860039-Amphidinium_carterae.1